MSLSKLWNNVLYSIPQSGERGWAALTNFLAALADNAQTTSKQFIGRRVATTTPVAVTATTDCYVGVNVAAAAATVNLPAGVNGQYFVIADESNAAATYNITIVPNGVNTINGGASYTLDANKQGVGLVFSGTDWKIFALYTSTALTPSSVTTFTNKKFVDNSCTFVDNGDNTKQLAFEVSGITTGTTRTITQPDRNVSLLNVPAALGAANRVLGVNSGATDTEFKDVLPGSAGSDFAIAHTANTITINLPAAAAAASGKVNTSAQSFGGLKKFEGGLSNTGNVAANDSGVTFTNADNRTQICTPTAARTYTLPTTTILAGDCWTFDNQSLFLITVNSSGGNLVGYVWPRSSSKFVAQVATPTTAANWQVNYPAIIPAIVQANDAATTFTFLDNQFQSSNPTSPRTYTLPTTGVPAGYIFEIYNRATSIANYITVQSSGSNTVTILPPLGRVRLQANTSTPTTAAHWTVLDRVSEWVAYTPSITGLGTITNLSAFCKVTGDSSFIRGRATTGTPTAVLATLPIPTGFTISNTKIPSNATGGNGPVIGIHAMQNASDTSGCMVTATTTSTSVAYFAANINGLNALTPQLGNAVYPSSKDFSFNIEVPIA